VLITGAFLLVILFPLIQARMKRQNQE